MTQPIFVTGANGFIGRHVVSALRDAGLATRVLLSRPDEKFGRLFDRTETVVGDLLDQDVLDRGLNAAASVVHLACKSIDYDGSGFDRVNIEGARLLADRVCAMGVKRLIYVSSVGVYGHGGHSLADETTPLDPDTPFSRSKADAERIFLQRHRQGRFEVAILRHRFVYGVGDRAVLPRYIKAAGKYPFLVSGGRARTSFIWAADLARVIARLATGEAELDAENPVYHVTDGQPLSYRRIIMTLCHSFGWKPPQLSIPLGLLYLPVRLRERLLGIDPETGASSISSIRLKLAAQENTFSNSRLVTILPDQNFHTFSEGFEASLDYYRSCASGKESQENPDERS